MEKTLIEAYNILIVKCGKMEEGVHKVRIQSALGIIGAELIAWGQEMSGKLALGGSFCMSPLFNTEGCKPGKQCPLDLSCPIVVEINEK